jgi:hypothetical protein
MPSSELEAQVMRMSHVVVSTPNFRMVLQSRGTGKYGYVIGQPHLEDWAEPSSETFATVAEADEAGRRAMKMAAANVDSDRIPS